MKLYVVQNADGKFFRPIGYGGYGEQWKDKLEQAKFYSKIGTAKGRCTWYHTNYPKYECPHLLEFSLEPGEAKTVVVWKDTEQAIARKKRKVEQKERMEQVKRDLSEFSDLFPHRLPFKKI
jgi:hypothetical protein